MRKIGRVFEVFRQGRRIASLVAGVAVILSIGGCYAQGYVSALTAVVGLGQSSCPSTPAPVITRAYIDKSIARVNQSLKFYVEASDSNASPLAYSWNFGDGESSADAKPTKNYTKTGRYLITVTVSNRCKSSEFKFELEVKDCVDVEWSHRLGLAVPRGTVGGFTSGEKLEWTSAEAINITPSGNVEVVGQVSCGGCHSPKKTLQSTDPTYSSHPEILGTNAYSGEFTTSGAQLRLRRLGDNVAELGLHHSHCALTNAISPVDGSYFSGGAIGNPCGSPKRGSVENIKNGQDLSFDSFKSRNGAFVRREDANGTLTWSKSLCKNTASTFCDSTRVVRLLPTEDLGVIAIASASQSFVRRFKFDGSVSWTTEILDGAPVVHDAKFGKSNAYFIVLTSQKGSPGAFSGVAIIRITLDGKIVWKKELSNTIADEPKTIFINDQEEIYISGKSSASLFVMKLDKDGKLLWKNSSAGSSSGVANVVIEADEILYIAGEDSINKDALLLCASPSTGTVFSEMKFVGDGDDSIASGIRGLDKSLFFIGNTTSSFFLGKPNIGRDYQGFAPYQDGFVMRVSF